MERIAISNEVSFSRIIQGWWRLDKWAWTPEETAKHMNELIDRGITTFDTAEIYANKTIEKFMGDALKADPTIRKRIQLVTKTGICKNGSFYYYDTRYNRVKEACHDSLERLNTDYIDLYLIHREDQCIDFDQTAKALTELKAEGKVREIGVSNFDPMKFNCLNDAVGGVLRTNQIEWNPTCFEHINTGMIDLLTAKHIHPMIWSPLGGGNVFSSEAETAVKARTKIEEIADRHNADPSSIVYAWLMYHPVGAMPIIGTGKLERAELAIKALDIKLEQYEWFEIYSASGQQKIR